MRLRTRSSDESGVALITALLAVMLVGALAAGMFAAIQSDQRGSAIDRDQTQAYAAAHAGLEKFTSDLAQLFTTDVSPSITDINNLAGAPPAIPGFTFTSPGGGSGYTIAIPPDVNPADGVPDPTPNATVTTGPFTGFQGLITPYTMTVTARSTNGGSEVRLRRGLQTVAIPIFQFGIFSDSDLSIFAGGGLNFGGRVHSNGSLFLAPQTGWSITFNDRITAAREVIRAYLSNGRDNSGTNPAFAGQLLVPTTSPTTTRHLARTEDSVDTMPGTAANPDWTDISTNIYRRYIMSGNTGANVLNLPLVDQGAQPVDLIRRPPANENTTDPLIHAQRFYAQASLRILLSDRISDYATLPTLTADAPVLLDGTPTGYGPIDATHPPFARLMGSTAITVANTSTYSSGVAQIHVSAIPANYLLPTLTATRGATVVNNIQCLGKSGPTNSAYSVNTFVACTPSLPTSSGGLAGGTVTATVNGQVITRTIVSNNSSSITVGTDGTAQFSQNLLWLPNAAGVDVPVTCEGYTQQTPIRFLNCRGLTAVPAAGTYNNATKALADPDTPTIGGYIKIERRNIVPAGTPPTWTDVTMEILNLGIGDRNSGGTQCNDPNPTAVLRLQRLRDNGGGTCTYFQSTSAWDWWPQTLYDPREGTTRDAATTDPMRYAGVMQYIALDVNNLRRWLAGTIGTTGNQTAQAASGNGFIVYFSDRRGNHNAAGNETGEFGFEDHVNSTVANGTPDGVLQAGEDVNAVPGTPTTPYVPTQELYGATPSAIGAPAGVVTTGVAPFNTITAGNAAAMRVNRVMLFRRALKLVNGGLGNLPATGLTVAAENPVYVQGNYNATVTSNTWPADWNTQASAPAAIIGDAITLLSNSWRDAASFESPNSFAGRVATNTAYRFAALAGKGLSFPYCGAACGNPGDLFGTDGGAANFLRMLENWSGQTTAYRGSLVSLHINRQAIGTYKFGGINNVYNAGARAFSFDINFLTPANLPPGTPMFRDVNTLQFRQILRPNE